MTSFLLGEVLIPPSPPPPPPPPGSTGSGCFSQCITYTPLEYNEDIPLNEPLGYSTATLPNPDDVDSAEICVTVDVSPQGSLRNIEVQVRHIQESKKQTNTVSILLYCYSIATC